VRRRSSASVMALGETLKRRARLSTCPSLGELTPDSHCSMTSGSVPSRRASSSRLSPWCFRSFVIVLMGRASESCVRRAVRRRVRALARSLPGRRARGPEGRPHGADDVGGTRASVVGVPLHSCLLDHGSRWSGAADHPHRHTRASRRSCLCARANTGALCGAGGQQGV